VERDQQSIAWSGGEVSAAWHHAEHGDTYLVLAHGAGGNMHSSGLPQLGDALASAGLGVVRFNFPYAEARRRAPDRQPTLETCYRAVADAVRPLASALFLGGRSMGGRIASHIASGGYRCAGLVFLSYPLHPPGQPERLRDRHLYDIRVPMLFIQGTRDAFARRELLARVLERLPTSTLHPIDGADHGLKVSTRDQAEVTGEIVSTIAAWIRKLG
jgi:predicted alpha/beta-hydrolase family hydrolase